MNNWTPTAVKNLFAVCPRAIEDAIVEIFVRNQTSDEQASHTTSHDNGIGFNGVDAELLSSFAERIINFRKRESVPGDTLALTGRIGVPGGQMPWAAKKVAKYAAQYATLLNEAIAASQAVVVEAEKINPIQNLSVGELQVLALESQFGEMITPDNAATQVVEWSKSVVGWRKEGFNELADMALRLVAVAQAYVDGEKAPSVEKIDDEIDPVAWVLSRVPAYIAPNFCDQCGQELQEYTWVERFSCPVYICPDRCAVPVVEVEDEAEEQPEKIDGAALGFCEFCKDVHAPSNMGPFCEMRVTFNCPSCLDRGWVSFGALDKDPCRCPAGQTLIEEVIRR